ncbi:MAG: hypothetical protein Q4G35_06920 [Propionibacteriaceae bacterium]|nr:hypothetical protein [Propionibacteriaceae bacterium]
MSAKTISQLIASVSFLAVGLVGCATVQPPADAPATTLVSPVTESEAPAPAETSTPAEAQPEESEVAEGSEDPGATKVPEGTEFPAPVDPAPNGLPGAASCYDEAGEQVAAGEGLTIEPGAAQAWLCGDAPGGYGTVGPLEPLIGEHVDKLISDYNSLPALTSDEAQAAASYTHLVFVYPDGDKRVIGFDAQDSTAVVGGVEAKQGSLEFYHNVRGLWLDQRLSFGADVPTGLASVVATCPAPEHFIVNHPIDDTQAGWACQGGSEEFNVKAIDDQLAKDIAAAIAEGSLSADASVEPDGPSISLMVPWGESTTLVKAANHDGYLWRSDQGMMLFTPQGDLANAMRDAITPTSS